MKHTTIRLQECLKTFTTDQDKAIKPEDTLARFYRQLENLDTTILSEVKRIDTGRLGIPVYFSVCSDHARALTGTKKQMGKGASPMQAQASACMELAERFSFFSYLHNQKNFLTGDYQTLRSQGLPLLDIKYLLRSVDDSTMTARMLEQLLEGIPMQWAWATNLTEGTDVLLPLSWFYAINEFNGSSAGNTQEEALVQGMSEVVERHVCAVIDRHKLPVPLILPETITDTVALDLIEKFRRNGIELFISDCSLDMGICTIGALAYDPATFPESSEIVYTAGTATDPQKAIIRAVTEVAQLAGDFNTHANYVASGLPKPLTLDEVSYITDAKQRRKVADLADISDHDIAKEVKNALVALNKNDFTVFAIDVTHEQLAIPAMYTIIPGAQFRERSICCDAGLFVAKLLIDLVPDQEQLAAKLSQLENLLPHAYYIQFYKGRLLAEHGQLKEALSLFENALHLDPQAEDIPYIYSYTGNCLKDLGRYQEAIAVLEKGLAEDEERPDMHNMMGVCSYKLNEFEKAIVHFKRAVELNPASAIDYANLGVNHAKLGNNTEAVEYFTLALTMDPSLDFARSGLARIAGTSLD